MKGTVMQANSKQEDPRRPSTSEKLIIAALVAVIAIAVLMVFGINVGGLLFDHASKA